RCERCIDIAFINQAARLGGVCTQGILQITQVRVEGPRLPVDLQRLGCFGSLLFALGDDPDKITLYNDSDDAGNVCDRVTIHAFQALADKGATIQAGIWWPDNSAVQHIRYTYIVDELKCAQSFGGDVSPGHGLANDLVIGDVFDLNSRVQIEVIATIA